MNGRRSSWLLASAVLAITGCNVEFPVRITACRDAPDDTRVNERGDQNEFTGHPLAAAALGNGRVLVAFQAQTFDNTTGETLTSEVRIAVLDQATGEPITLCNTSNRDRTLSTEGVIAFGASVAPVDLTIGVSKAVALVAWTEGDMLPDSFVEMRFIDGAGCPLAVPFRPYAGPALTSSIAWSEHRHAVLATLTDERNIYRAWVSSVGSTDTVSVAATQQGFFYGFPVGAVASDGSAVVVWAKNVAGAFGILLDPDGNPRASAGSSGDEMAFPIDLPLITQDDQVEFLLSVAAADQFVIAAEQRALNRSVPSRVMAREYALGGTALGPAYLLDPSDSQDQGAPTFRYAPDGTLVAVWDSTAAGGTVGRLFGAGGSARFNTSSCDDGRFSTGERTKTMFGYPSLLVSNGRVLVAHNGEGGGDPLGSATFMWNLQFAALWPGPQ
jgi:hypothetical protein